MPVLFLIGVLLGVTLYQAAFGFSSAYRKLFTHGDTAAARAQLVMLSIATLLFAPVLATGSVFGLEVTGAMAPAGAQVAIGAFLFGIGMQLAGGCGSRTLYAVGSGSPRMVIVLGVRVDGKQRLYPFSVFKTSPVINDEVGRTPVVIFSKEGTLSALDAETIRDSRTIPSATAFERRLEGNVLTFETREGRIYDPQTGSQWNLLGQAIDGKLKGRRLQAVEGGVHFAFAWLAFAPDAEIFSRRQK